MDDIVPWKFLKSAIRIVSRSINLPVTFCYQISWTSCVADKNNSLKSLTSAHS
uniref:Uncharacterized protein n=1 Tax=Anguilla anguilla TaxID=7936 RepID=A0A0E9STM0_ANGAN